ncbi:DUF3558 domain-containing protein [Amycolatopsis sp. NEAU-NG30]|uniref:DUF3558 domain-containing protein n=1 Tax=Amycolatopsis melonis TaxID=3156488 RepID=A0ABV0LMF3_9PSEU
MRRLFVLISASLLALTACSPEKAKTTSPIDSSGPSQTQAPVTADAVPGPRVPKVDNAIDVTRFLQAPCDSLTADQIKTLLGAGVTPKTELDAPAGPSCSIHPPTVSDAGVVVMFSTVDKRGLTSIYQAQGTKYRFFMPMDAVDGYPAVAYGITDGRKTDGICQVAVGVSDQQTVDIAITQSKQNIGHKDPCEAAHGVAESVVGNLRGAR